MSELDRLNGVPEGDVLTNLLEWANVLKIPSGDFVNADLRRAAARIAALEAALRDIEAAWDNDAIPTEDVGARMYLIARAALAPAPAPEAGK